MLRPYLHAASLPAAPHIYMHKISHLWRTFWARTWYLWGLSLCYSGQRMSDRSFFEGGLSAYERAIRQRPDFALAYYQRGLVRGRELGEYQAALSDLACAIALRPEWPDPYLQRGLFQRFNGAPAAALADLRRYLELAPPGYWRDEASRQVDALTNEMRDGE
jgi:tetratricopeptide (TPR) repeat protein